MANLLLSIIIKLFLRKEVKNMAIIYATLIVKGLKTIDDVPQIIKEDVKAVLIALEVPTLAE